MEGPFKPKSTSSYEFSRKPQRRDKAMKLRRLSPLLTLLAATTQAQVASFTLARASYVNIEPGPSSYFIESTFSATVQTTSPSDFDAFAISGPAPEIGRAHV